MSQPRTLTDIDAEIAQARMHRDGLRAELPSAKTSFRSRELATLIGNHNRRIDVLLEERFALTFAITMNFDAPAGADRP